MKDKHTMSLKEYLSEKRGIVDAALERLLPSKDCYPPLIFEAMRYSIFAGGKRLRPIFCLAAAEILGGKVDDVLSFACALEMIHTYSLIHDDLPAMDDDDYRRGILTNHRVFGEGVAILAGDALLTEAFSVMSMACAKPGSPSEISLSVINEVARAAGSSGMIGGQIVDLLSEGSEVDRQTLDYIHTHKTEKLITVSLRVGALLAGADEKSLEALTLYGKRVGLAFQIADDILDIEGSQEMLGKDIGSDEERGKVTFPSLVGLEESRILAGTLVKDALSALKMFDDRADPLRHIARYIVDRKS